VAGWRVDVDAEVCSDHRPIVISLGRCEETLRRRARVNKRFPRWVVNRLDVDRLEAEALAAAWVPISDSLGVEGSVSRLTEILKDICDCAMPRATAIDSVTKPIYWWNDEIARLRSVCIAARRRLYRCRRRASYEVLISLRAGLRDARRALRREISVAKRRAWAELLAILESDPWDRPYRVVFKNVRAPVAPICGVLPPEFLERVVGALFPLRLGGVPPAIPPVEWDLAWDVTRDETIQAFKGLSSGRKAPGPDGVPGVVLKKTAGILLSEWVRIFTGCLREAVFPSAWKIARLVLLRKEGKPEDDTSAYRPICLLDEAGKVFERIIAERLRMYLDESNGLSSDQYGFRRGHSTTDAIMRVRNIVRDVTGEGGVVLAISLDVANAFNSLPWSIIREALDDKGVPPYLRRILDSYLDNRQLCYVGRGGCFRTVRVTCGVPQGSVLGPTLWNIGYDAVLRADLPLVGRYWDMRTIRLSWWRGTPCQTLSGGGTFVCR